MSESKGPEAAKKIAESILENLNEKKSISKTLKSNGLKWEETGEFNEASAFIPKMGAASDKKHYFQNIRMEQSLVCC